MKGIKETLEFLAMIKVFAIGGVKIFADGKVNGKDFPATIEMAKQYEVIIDGINGSGEILAEAKDVDQAELLALGTATYNAYREIAEAKRLAVA